MKLLGQTVLALAIFGSIKAQNQDNCHTYAAGACRDTSDHWSVQGSSCNAVYGNIAGNKHNLGKLMADNLKQSFQFIAMVNRNLVINVCSEKKYTKRSSVLLLRLVYFFSERTLSLILRYVLWSL